MKTPSEFPESADADEMSGSEDVSFDEWNGARGRASNQEIAVSSAPDGAPVVAHRSAPRVPVAGWPPKAGTVLLGKYRIDKVLGQGGMGVVVSATHLQLQQTLAIKFLHPSAMKEPDVVARFAQEARVLASIQSEHVVRVLDVGALETGEPFIAMEYLEGIDLSRAVRKRGPLPIEEAAHHIIEACEPLAEAHAAGIVHRDLKPSNLYLTKRADGTVIIKVIDFGISKMKPSENELSMTKTSVILGSPLYISPEQLRSSKDVDGRSDIWALGVILYKILTGKPPFISDSIAQLCTMILIGEAPKMSESRPEIPEELDALVLKCLAKDPAMRFQNVAELAAALSVFCAGPGVEESVTRTSRLLNSMPRALGVVSELSAPSRRASTIPKAGTPSSMSRGDAGITDGSAARTLGVSAASALEPPMAPPPVDRKAAPRPLLSVPMVVLAVFALGGIGAAWMHGSANNASPATVSTPIAPAVPSIASASQADTPEVPFAPGSAAATPSGSASAAPRTTTTPTNASAPVSPIHAQHPVVITRPPPPAKPPKLDNSQFGDRK